MMGEILTFAPRLRPAEPETLPPLTDTDLRERIEAGAQAALDVADHFIALLDRIDGCPDAEDGADSEPSLAAPEHHDGSQVGWCRGNDGDREAETPEIVLPEVAIISPVPKLRPAPPLPWGGEGNVVAAAGAALLALVAGA